MKDDAKYGTGDTVKMKSGGLEMTVRGFEKTDSTRVDASDAEALVRAEWMSDDGKVHSHTFPREMLESVKVEDKSDKQSGSQSAIARQDTKSNPVDRLATPPRVGPAADEPGYQARLHAQDGLSQSRGNFADSAPSQALEQPTSDNPNDDWRPVDDKRPDPKGRGAGPGSDNH